MKSILRITFVIVFCSSVLLAQEISFIPQQTSVSDTAGDEVIIYVDLVNISQAVQTVFVIRTQNQLPDGWSTSLCFDYCYPDWIDSIATTSDFGSTPLQPGESREVSVHFFTTIIPNTGMVQLQAGTFRNPDHRITVELHASTFDPTSVEEDFNLADNFILEQNYPNPFNPKTKIRFSIPLSTKYSSVPQNVTLKIYDILGNEIATLVNEYKFAGNYEVTFDASKYNLPSGIYFYQLRDGSFTQTKAMLLEK